MTTTRKSVDGCDCFIRDGCVYQIRPKADVENDGHPCPKACRYVVFRVFTRPNNEVEADAQGYAATKRQALNLDLSVQPDDECGEPDYETLDRQRCDLSPGRYSE